MTRETNDPAAPGGLSEHFWNHVIHPDKERLENWREMWSKIIGQEQTVEYAAEANRNFFGLLKVLAEVDDRLRREGKSAVEEGGGEAGEHGSCGQVVAKPRAKRREKTGKRG